MSVSVSVSVCGGVSVAFPPPVVGGRACVCVSVCLCVYLSLCVCVFVCLCVCVFVTVCLVE